VGICKIQHAVVSLFTPIVDDGGSFQNGSGSCTVKGLGITGDFRISVSQRELVLEMYLWSNFVLGKPNRKDVGR
jgi:hypothetical protein